MAIYNHIVNSLVSGEVSPKFIGRTDTQQYNQGAEELLNALIFPQGGSGRRGGTSRVAGLTAAEGYCEAADDEEIFDARLFKYSTSDGARWQILLTLIVGNNGSRLGGHAFNMSRFTKIDLNIQNDGLDFADLAQNLQKVQVAQSGNTLVLACESSMPVVIVPEITSFTAEIVTFFLRYITDNDVIHPDTAQYDSVPFQNPITGNDSAGNPVKEITAGAFSGDDANLTSSDITFDATWVGRVIRFSAASKTVVGAITAYSTSGGAHLVFTKLGGDSSVFPDDFGPDAGTSYELPYWDKNFAGFPRTVAFADSHLAFGGNRGFPDTMWFSQLNNIYIFRTRRFEQDPDFADPVTESDPFSHTLKADKVGFIQWMRPGVNITVGTIFAEYIVRGPDTTKAISGLNVSSNQETPYGSAFTQAVSLENTTVFLQRDRKKLREMVYSLDENSFKADDLNIIAEHIAEKSAFKYQDEERPFVDQDDPNSGYFKRVDIAQMPNGMVWALDSKGMLCGITRERGQQVAAWHYHELGGISKITRDFGVDITHDYRDIDHKPKIIDISVGTIPGDIESDELWVVVSRGYKDRTTGRYLEGFFVERLNREWLGRTIKWVDWYYDDNPQYAYRLENLPVFSDCAIVAGDNVTDNDDKTHIDLPAPYSPGDTVVVVCNGYYFGEYEVQDPGAGLGGYIDISVKAAGSKFTKWNAIVGYNYVADVVPVTPEVPVRFGSSIGNVRSIASMEIFFYRSIGCKFGMYNDPNQVDTPHDPLEEIVFRADPDDSTDPTPLFTGGKTVIMPGNLETRPRIHIQSHLPLPMQVSYVVAKYKVYE